MSADAAAARAPGAAGVAGAAPPVVLLVDDEADILGSVRLLLGRSRLRPRVLTAGSGAEALEILARERIDLLVSDFKMPGMDGIQLLVAARQSRPDVRRVLFTAYADAELQRRAEAEAGLSAFLPKTLDSRELLVALEPLMVPAGPDEAPPVAGGLPP